MEEPDKDFSQGIIPVFMGGLGNQMFILAAAYVVSRVKLAPLFLLQNPNKFNKHNNLDINYNTTFFRHFAAELPFHKESSDFHNFVQQYNYTRHHAPGFAPWIPEFIRPGTLMTSYYQFYPALAPYENEIRDLFLKGLAEQRERLMAAYDISGAAFLHIRRGDYLEIPHIHYIQPLDYYKAAMEKVGGVRKYFVFSDDIAWVRQQEFFQQDIFHIVDSKDELESIALMSLCEAGAICANSTFSWWGAFLGAYANRAPVCVPQRWISDPVVSLFPDEWHVL